MSDRSDAYAYACIHYTTPQVKPCQLWFNFWTLINNTDLSHFVKLHDVQCTSRITRLSTRSIMQALHIACRLHTAGAKTVSLTSSVASWALATRTVRHSASSSAKYKFFIVPNCCCICSVECFPSVDWAFLIWCSRSVGFYRQLTKTTARSVAVATSNGHYSSSLFKKFCFYRWHVSE